MNDVAKILIGTLFGCLIVLGFTGVVVVFLEGNFSPKGIFVLMYGLAIIGYGIWGIWKYLK